MNPGDRPDPLGMPAAEMRRLGYWVVDRVVEHYESGVDGPSIRTGDAAELQGVLGGPVPQEPGDPRAALETLVDVVLSQMQHGDHPRYFARVPGPSSFAGVLGEWLGTGFNALASSWGGGSGPATVELIVLDWIRTLLGMPAGTEGVILSGGSLSNMTALAAAREALGPGVAYLSDQTHASVGRGLEALGFPPDQIRMLQTNERFRLTAEVLAEAIRRDRDRGERPRFVIATAGTTNTGAVDELDAIADVCVSEGLWFHVDGAYGAPAAFCDAGREALAGLERADSLALDPHKWLFTPYDAGILLVRHPGTLERAFSMRPEYLADVRSESGNVRSESGEGRSESGEVSFGDRSLELSRRPRALKLWMMFRTYGARRISDAIERGITLAERAQAMIEADPTWECVTPAQLGIVTFTRPGWDAQEHASRVAALTADGFATLTSTMLRGRPVLRLCTINPRTTEADIAGTLARLAA